MRLVFTKTIGYLALNNLFIVFLFIVATNYYEIEIKPISQKKPSKNNKVETIKYFLDRSLSSHWVDYEMYSRFLRFRTLNTEDPKESAEISLDVNNTTRLTIGFLDKNQTSLWIYRKGAWIGFSKTEFKELKYSNESRFFSYDVFETNSEISLIKKIIIKNGEGNNNCGSWIELEMYDNKKNLLLKKDGVIKYGRNCD